MKIESNDNGTTIVLSQELLSELNNQVNKIISDNSLEDPYAIEKIILSTNKGKVEFEIDLTDVNDKEQLEIDQIIHQIK